MGEVRGRVIDAGADVPLAAASLTIEGNGATRLATSALDGAFAFAGVSPGRYTLVVVRTAYRPLELPRDQGRDEARWGNRDGRTLFIWGAKDAGARVTLDGVPLGAPCAHRV